METEIEAKFLDIDPAAIRRALAAAGATLVQEETLMKRRVFEHPTNKVNDWLRVRDEGGKVTMSYKKMIDRTLHGTQEATVEVSDFDDACAILRGAQLREVAYQETLRETWKRGDTTITIDTWPWVPPFVEIEGPSEAAVKDAASALGLSWSDAMHGSVEPVYQRYYDVTEEEVDDWEEITFGPVPEWLRAKEKH